MALLPKGQAMRRSDVIFSIGLLALAVGLSPAVSFDGTMSPEGAPVSVPLPGGVGTNPGINATPLAAVPVPPVAVSPFEAFRSGTQALRQGRADQAVAELEYAAEQGIPGAMWKLGRMYADGEGVPVNKERAYEYFKRLTTIYGDDSAGTPYAPFVSKAFVNLGQYYFEGIPGTVSANPMRAREAFRYAASYFGDGEAQYYLGRMFLKGEGGQKNAKEAARWLSLSAEKGDARAQALLGEMLFKGNEVPRQAARGLFWLIVAKDGAGTDEAWISDVYTAALAQANESDRALAHKYLEDWLKRRP
jgi:TPR repeat protein